MLTFSELYLRPTALQDDSVRMRVQLLAAFEAHPSDAARQETAELLARTTGGQVPPADYGYNWQRFFERGELRDILDLVTLTDVALGNLGQHRAKASWRSDVQFIFDRQNMRYRLDEEGVVRLRVDEAFEIGRGAALSGLDHIRYGAARAAFESAYQALAATAPDGKQAIRSIVEAVEIVFKLSFSAARRIGAEEIGTHLLPSVQARYGADQPALEAATRLVNELKEWLAAAQFYRHGQAQAEPAQPPLELTVLLLGAGTSHLRWLIELDQGKPQV
ncbi:hypothetical protein [Frigidibacter sp.]|uniref:hypothetical protein n=1 Tax=Frigidibacter sp. TaxID=2586418 RepID=UPI002733D689|nr:hypothetical protein [Frigidibacter sp.]MDP3342290.1 hypothetical protein [Frigidibacter sp.]